MGLNCSRWVCTNPDPPYVRPSLNEELYNRIPLDDLLVGSTIGTGRFSKIYVVRTRETNDNYALKVYNKAKMSKVHYKLAWDEANNIQNIHHLNIIYAQSIMIEKSYLCFIMPLMVRRSCDKIVQNLYPGGLPEPAIGMIIKEVLKAVDYLQKKRIVHGLIKASHVMIDRKGNVLLSGLKYMKMIECEETVFDPKRVEMMKPYLHWLSPEILDKDKNGFGFSSDIYSIGILTLELCNGVVPFAYISPDENLIKLLQKVSPRIWGKRFLPSQEKRQVTAIYDTIVNEAVAAQARGSILARAKGTITARVKGVTFSLGRGSITAQEQGTSAAQVRDATAAQEQSASAAQEQGASAAQEQGASAAQEQGASAAPESEEVVISSQDQGAISSQEQSASRPQDQGATSSKEQAAESSSQEEGVRVFIPSDRHFNSKTSSHEILSFTRMCLIKNPDERPSLASMMTSKFIAPYEKSKAEDLLKAARFRDLIEWNPSSEQAGLPREIISLLGAQYTSSPPVHFASSGLIISQGPAILPWKN